MSQDSIPPFLGLRFDGDFKAMQTTGLSQKKIIFFIARLQT
jgi:hypothetical protein